MRDKPVVEFESDDPWAVGPLGSVIESLHPPARARVAVFALLSPFFIFGGGTILFGLSCCWLGYGEPEGVLVACAGAFFIVLAVGFATLFTWSYGRHVHLCERGFYCDRSRTRRIFQWTHIRVVRETVVHHYRTHADWKAGRESRTNVCFEVVTIGNQLCQSFTFSRDNDPWLGPLEQELRKAAAQCGFAWRVSEQDWIDD